MKTTHKHHIIPRHMGGTDDPSNLIELTPKQHALAHKKLYEKHGKWEDKIAWQTLSGQMTKYELQQQIRRLANLGNTHFLGKTHTKETRKKISKYQKIAKLNNQLALGHKKSKKTKELISLKLKGNKNKLGKTGPQENPYTGERQWLLGENNHAKRPDVREKLRLAALRREALKRQLKQAI